MPPESDRRTLLRALASASVLTLAGCSGSDSQPTTAASTSTGTTEATTTESLAETGTPTDAERAALESTATSLVTDWADGDYESVRASFTDRMRQAISAEELRQLWGQLTASIGPFVSITDTRYTTSQGFDIVVVTARFSEGRQQFVVSFDDEQRVAGLRALPPEGTYEPPSYADQSAFTEQERTIEATSDCSLGATLTLPTGDEQVPGVVLVHGSGPHKRDVTIGPNRVFKDLAWGLASRGVAVLRYDKRTAVCDVDPTGATLDSVVTDDALAAVDVLQDEQRIASEDVVVAGHSLGGMVAPRIAARDDSLAGIAMLAPPARSLADLLDDQNEYVANLDGTVSEAEQEFLDEVRAKTDRIRTLNIGEDELVFGSGRPWWQSLQAYDQVETAQALSLPMYLLQGGRDYQVLPEKDFSRWQAALGGRESVSFEEYPQLDHLFMPGEEKSRPADYYESNSVAEQVVTDLATWTDSVTGDTG